ncbi:MAG: hypothetical protein LBG67_05685 [Campylobacteraceae bacterium]|nr:hypothetical protein [Campylobacteraceae bacterium]
MKISNFRAFASISLFFLVTILFVTAIGIEFIDHALRQREQILFHIILRIHVIIGFTFCAFSIIHIVNNWKLLKNYFIKNK